MYSYGCKSGCLIIHSCSWTRSNFNSFQKYQNTVWELVTTLNKNKYDTFIYAVFHAVGEGGGGRRAPRFSVCEELKELTYFQNLHLLFQKLIIR